MNKTIYKIFLPLTVLVAVLLGSSLMFADPYQVYLEDGGASLRAQGAFSWTPPGTTEANNYSDDYKFYVAGGQLYCPQRSGVMVVERLTSNIGIGFKLLGGNTYKLTVRHKGKKDTTNRGIRILRASIFNNNSTPIFIFDGDPTSGDVVVEHSAILAPTKDATYWISGLEGSSTLMSFDVEVMQQKTITSSCKWLADENDLAAGALFFNNRLKNNGSTKSSTTDVSITTGNVTYPTYDFSNSDEDYISLSTPPGHGFIRVFYNEGGDGSQTQTIIKTGDTYESSTVTPDDATRTEAGQNCAIKYYTFDNMAVSNVYITGGMIGAVEVVIDYDPTGLDAITEDVIWYSLGKTFYNQTRTQNGKDYFGILTSPLAQSSFTYTVDDANLSQDTPLGTDNNVLPLICVNGSQTRTRNADTKQNSNYLDKNQAIAFKLGANRKYRIRVFSSINARKEMLWKGDPLYNFSFAKATICGDETYSTQYQIKNNTGAALNTYVVTYEITTGKVDEVYWISPNGDRKMNIGAIEVLPWSTSTTIPSTVRAFTTTTCWKAGNNTVNIKEVEYERNLDIPIARSGQILNKVYVYGPSIALNHLSGNCCPSGVTQQWSRCLMIDRNNALGFKVLAGSKVTVNFIADQSSTDANALELYKGDTYKKGSANRVAIAHATNAGGNTLTYEVNEDQTLWLTVNNGSGNYVYVPGIYIEVDESIMQSIESNYLYKADGSVANNIAYDERRIKYIGDGLSVTSPSINVPVGPNNYQTTPNTSNQTFDCTAAGNDYFGFKIAKGTRGKIKVYYEQPTPTVNESLFNTAKGAGDATYNLSTHQVTFNITDDDDYAQHQMSWYWNDGTNQFKDFNTLEVTLQSSPMQLRLVAQDTQGHTIISDMCMPGGTSLSLDLNQGDFDKEHIKQIYLYGYDSGTVTLLSAKFYSNMPPSLGTGTDESNPATGYNKVVTRVATKTYGNSKVLTYPFNHLGADEDVLYWVNGDMHVAAIEVIFDEPIEEPGTSLGAGGHVYVKETSDTTDCAFIPRKGVWGKDHINQDRMILKLGEGTNAVNIMSFMGGTDEVYIYRENQFKMGGIYWDKKRIGGNEGGFLDNVRCSFQGQHNGDGNANPQTECNGGIGGPNTEGGGMWLQPISGDFFRLEPEYDGVVTMWILQNGNTDGNTSTTGKLTRRPTYVIDENGIPMQRSTVKPSFEYTYNPSHYAIDGTWVDINPESPIRSDYAEAWAAARSHWNTNYWTDGRNGDRYRETMKFYDFWYDGGAYTFDYPGDQIHLDDWNLVINGTNLETDGTSTLVSDQTVGLIVYGSDNLRRLEERYDLISSGQNSFSKYGYEVPVHLHVRYVFPVRAGKTYYLGGRGTKNGFMRVKFEPMPANYNNRDYIDPSLNYKVADGSATGKYILTEFAESEGGSQRFSANNYNTYFSSYSSIPTVEIDPDSNTDFNWSAYEGKTVNVKLKRTFTKDKWYPIVLPFSVSESKMREMFGADVQVLYLDPYDHTLNNKRGWTSAITPAVYDPHNYNSNNPDSVLHLKFTRHYYQMLYANTPAFICPSKTPTMNNGYLEFKNVHIEKTNLFKYTNDLNQDIELPAYKIGEGQVCEYWVVGSYKNTAKTDGNVYYIDNVDGKAVVYHSYSGVHMKGTRCWIVAKAKNSLHPIPILRQIDFCTFDGDDLNYENTDSGIEDIIMDDTVIDMYNDENVYDLMGRCVGHGSLDGLAKGIYIFKGRKFYIR